MRRRELLMLPLAAPWLGRRAQDDGAWFSISLAEWSFHRALQSGGMDHLDFISTARRDFGLDAVEYVNVFFFDKARDDAYLRSMNARAADEGVQSLLIMCDNLGDLGDPDGGRRTTAIERHHEWVGAGEALGCHAIRVNARSGAALPDDEQARLAADGLRRLCEYADGFGIDVIVENHGGISSNGGWLAGVMKRVDHPRIGTLPDFGNFRIEGDTWYDRYRGVRELMPWAKAVSAKSHDFDADGGEVHTDYERMLRIVRDAGYRGYVGIEYEGDSESEPEGVRKTRDLLLRVRRTLAEG